MFNSKYCTFITNFSRIGEKLIHQKINKKLLINSLDIKQLEITFRIPSESKFEHGFIALLMLTEKMLNNKPIFLLDKNTLSKKRTIKVGLVVTIKNEMINHYLNLCNFHSIPKFYNYGISFSISNANQPFIYKMKKILSNTIFNFDKDIDSYYDYLGELDYEFEFLFRTYFKNILMNKLIISNKGIYFSNLIELIKTETINDIEKQIELEELEEIEELEEFNTLEENIEEIELNINSYENNINDYKNEDFNDEINYYFNNDLELKNLNSEFNILIDNDKNSLENINYNFKETKIKENINIEKLKELNEENNSLEETNDFKKYQKEIRNNIEYVDIFLINELMKTFNNKYINIYIEKILNKDELIDNKILINNEN